MDQDKTDIPHIISKPKAMAGTQTLETHVTGIQAHGHCTLFTIDCGQFLHDSNLTIENLLQLFHELKVNRTATCTMQDTSWRKLCDAFIHAHVRPIRFTYLLGQLFCVLHHIALSKILPNLLDCSKSSL